MTVQSCSVCGQPRLPYHVGRCSNYLCPSLKVQSSAPRQGCPHYTLGYAAVRSDYGCIYECLDCFAQWILRDVFDAPTQTGCVRVIIDAILRCPVETRGLVPPALWPQLYKSLRDVPRYREELPPNPLLLAVGYAAGVAVRYTVLLPLDAKAYPPEGGWGWLESLELR